MVEIILTDVKQKKKFLSLPLNEQRKKGLSVRINSNESNDFFIKNFNDNDEDNIGQAFLIKELYDIEQKPLIDHFQDYCKKGKSAFIQGIEKLNGESNINEICETFKEDVTEDNYKQITIDGTNPYQVKLDYPLGIHPNPKFNKPSKILDLVRDIKDMESNLEVIKSNPFWKHYKKINKQLSKYQDKYGSGKNFKENLIPKQLIGEEISTDYPDKDEPIWVGFLSDDSMVWNPKLTNKKRIIF